MALMPGFNTRSAAEAAHQYATERLQQQEINLRGQGAQTQQTQFAQEQFMRQTRIAIEQMAQEQEGLRADREFAFKGAEQGVELGIKYDPATKAYRPLAAGDAEFQRWQERKAQKDAEAKMRTETQRADTIGGRAELARSLEPFAVASEGRRETTKIAEERRTEKRVKEAENRAVLEADRRFAIQQAAERGERKQVFGYQVRMAALNHGLKMVELEETLSAKGERAGESEKLKVLSEARKSMNEGFNQWQEAERTYTVEFDRILKSMIARTTPELTREEIVNHPSFANAMRPFEDQRQQARHMAAEAQARYYQTAGLPVPPQVQATLAQAPSGGVAQPAPTIKEVASRKGLPGPKNAPADQRPPTSERGGSMPSVLPGEAPSGGKPYSKLDGFMRALPMESQQKHAEAIGSMYALAFDNPAMQRTGISRNPVWEQAWNSLDDATKTAWMRFLIDTGAWNTIKGEQGNAR